MPLLVTMSAETDEVLRPRDGVEMSIRSQHEQEQRNPADGQATRSENVAWHTLAC